MTEMIRIVFFIFIYTVSGGCPEGWTDGVFGSMCYKYLGIKNLPYAGAKDLCNQEGGYMVMPKTSEEDAFLEELITNISISLNQSNDWRAWIGATDTDIEGQWLWEDGEPFNYSGWVIGQPDNFESREDCVEVFHAWNGWNDLRCDDTTSRVTVCQKQACPDGWFDGKNGHLCYKYLLNENLNYTDTFDRCQQIGGQIIMPKTSAEDLFLEDVIANVSNGQFYIVFLGITDTVTEGYWIWEDNEPMNYSRWYPGEPNGNTILNGENCAAYYGTWSWVDIPCGHLSTMTICQRERITCANDTKFVNSSGNLVEISGYTYGDNLTYSCEEPYHKVYGELTRMCTEYGTWRGIEPECERCSNGWEYGLETTCYKALGDGNYQEAVNRCSQERGVIIMPKTPQEDEFIRTFLNVSWPDGAWLGMTDNYTEGQWIWEDNKAVNFTNWFNGEPNGHTSANCAVTNNNGWYDRSCAQINFIFCQREIGITCPNETEIINSTGTLYDMTGNDVGDNLTYCEHPHYKLVSGDLTRTCMENETWSSMEPECEKVTCTNETTMLNISGTLLEISGYEYNDTLTYSCEPPYFKLENGDLKRTCTENETWSGMEPTCTKITCTSNTTSINSSGTLAEVSGYGYNDSLTYSCETPFYKLLGGDLVRRCTENGTWSGLQPMCEKITCSNETTHVNSSGKLALISGYHYNDRLTYSCDAQNYRHVMGDLLRNCIGNGTWSGIEPTCRRCQCPCLITSVVTNAEVFEKLINEMKVDKKKTSKSIRKKTSANDSRPSAKAVGSVGITLFVILGVLLVVPDIPSLRRNIRFGSRNIKSFFKRNRIKASR